MDKNKRREYLRKYNQTEKRKAYNKQYNLLRKEKQKEYQRNYYEIHKEILYGRKNEHHRKWILNIKIKVLSHYGLNNKLCCVKCGHDNITALTIDHINGGGIKHRKKDKLFGSIFYIWLIKNNYPEGYQTLCMNCQLIQNFLRNSYSLPHSRGNRKPILNTDPLKIGYSAIKVETV